MQAQKFDGGLELLVDGYAKGIQGGMDSSISPDLIGADYAAMVVNATFRGGRPHTRPGYKEITFAEGPWKSTLINGLFLGGGVYYKTVDGVSRLVGVYDGYVLAVDPDTGIITCLNEDDKNNGLLRCWMVQAQQWLIVQNGSDLPLIYDIETDIIRRSRTEGNNPFLEVTSLTQVNGLATVVVAGGHPFQVGDKIEIQNADPAGYDLFYTVRSATYNTFTIDVTSSLKSPAVPFNLVYPVLGNVIVVRYEPEIPRGLLMAYGQNRIFVSSPDRTKFFAGNILMGDGTESDILRFSEDEYLAEGGYFCLPANQGRITALSFIPLQDVNTGQGVLFAFGEYGISSLDVSLYRPEWKNNQIQKVAFIDEGATSHHSCVGVNGDLMYRSLVGIRSYRNARADMESFGQTPLSTEVRRILDTDVERRLQFVSAISFDNRLLTTCSPEYDERFIKVIDITVQGDVTYVNLITPSALEEGREVTLSGVGYDGTYTVTEIINDTTFTIATPLDAFTQVPANGFASGAAVGTQIFHRGVVVLDYNSLSGARGKREPAWDGVWSGLNFQQLVTTFDNAAKRAYAFTFDGTASNSIWRITKDEGNDINWSGSEKRIQAYIETRAFDFSKPLNQKSLRRLDMWLEGLDGVVEYQIEYRNDTSCWNTWQSFQRCAIVSDPVLEETNINVIGLFQNLPQSRSQISIGTPPVICDNISRGLTYNGFEFQIRITWTGIAQLSKLLLYGYPIVEAVNATCPAGPLTPV